jgi:pimeloyl-ACP methyl ester carboxylesterase
MTIRRWIETNDGWRLALKRVAPLARRADDDALPFSPERPANPVLIVPGYGMNSFIFGFHPQGLSLEAYLASRGIDVYSVDLRAQGKSERTRGDLRYGMADLALTDIGTAIRGVLEWSGAERVDLIGCSLGASLAFAHVACVKSAPVRKIVSMAGVVTWVDAHPLVRAAFFSPRLVGMIPLTGTRAFAGRALPLLARFAPRLLGAYLNPSSTDVSQSARMVETVEDPTRHMNREIAEWMARRELVVADVNVSRALGSLPHPVMVVVANQDGIVPPAAGRAIYEAVGSAEKELLCVGEANAPLGHADLFIATGIQEKVFDRVVRFLDG